MSRGTDRRNDRSNRPRKLSGDKGRTIGDKPMIAALALDTNDVTQLVSNTLRLRFGDSKSAVKLIARVANSNERAAENWLNGRCAPTVAHFIRLAAQVPELKAEVRRLLELEADLDPEAQELMARVVQYAAKRGIG